MFPTISGFANAPVTKALMVICGGSSVLASTFNLRHTLTLTRANLVTQGEIWRLATHHFFFRDTLELISGLVLLYYCRLFERQMSSKKFLAFTGVSFLVSTLVELAVLMLVPSKEISFSGPYGLIFSLLVQFWFTVPPSHRFSFLKIPLSDKLFNYMWAIELMSAQLPSSLIHSFCGIVAGLLYYFPAFGLSSFQIPSRVLRILQIPEETPFQSTPDLLRQPPQNHQNVPQNPGMAQNPIMAQNNPHYPSEANILTLVNLGFPREQATMALMATGNEVTLAVNALLGGN